MYNVNTTTNCLVEIPRGDRLLQTRGTGRVDRDSTYAHGILKRVRILSSKTDSHPKVTILCYGRINSQDWDPEQFQWPGGMPFMHYTAKLGRTLMQERHNAQDVISMKWSGILPPNFKLKWTNIWDKERVRKEEGLLW